MKPTSIRLNAMWTRLTFWAFLLAAIVLLGCPPAHADQSLDRSKYVPRAEYEQLKQRFEDVLKRLEALEKRQAPAADASAQTPQPLQRAESAGAAQTNIPPAETEKASKPLAKLAKLTPGYEAARIRRLAEPSQPPPLSLRIAQMADMDLYMGFSSVGRLQYFSQDNVWIDGKRPDRLQAGFQTPFANVSFLAQYQDVLDVYFDFYIASRSHPDYMQGGQGYMLIKDLPARLKGFGPSDWFFENFNIKAGGFEVDYGDAHYRRSNAGQVQQNPLIGNYLVDPRGIDIGLELISESWPLKWLVGVGSGTYEGHFGAGSGYAAHAKFWGDPYPGLRTSLSLYRADHSGDGPGWPPGNGTAGDLFVTNRSGGAYDGVFGGGDAPGQLMPGAGQLVSAAQADFTWRHSPIELYGYLGYVHDADTNGSSDGNPEESWYYYAAEGIYNFTDRLYLAGRYSGAAAGNIKDASSDGLIHRLALGGGYWLFDAVLIKLELTYQELTGFDPQDGKVCGVDAWRDPSFYGVITEASFGF